MANICCVVHNSIAHIDFGGMSFFNLAKALQNQGHDVTWIVGNDRKKDNSHYSLMKKLNGDFNNVIETKCKFSYLNENKEQCIYELAKVITEFDFELFLIDRYCILAEEYCRTLNKKWVAIGTNGLDWKIKTKLGLDRAYITCESNTLKNKNSSNVWCKSPYLNISFFPDYFWGELISTNTIAQFKNVETTTKKDKYVLVTFGNSMPKKTKNHVIDFIDNHILNKNKILILTGNEEEQQSLNNKYSNYDSVFVHKWMDYNDAFNGALWAIGHGGCAFLWYAFKFNIPVICFPTLADQFFNTNQVIKNRLGYGIYSYEGKKKYLPPFLKKYTHHSKNNLNSIYRKINRKKTHEEKPAGNESSIEVIINRIESLID